MYTNIGEVNASSHTDILRIIVPDHPVAPPCSGFTCRHWFTSITCIHDWLNRSISLLTFSCTDAYWLITRSICKIMHRDGAMGCVDELIVG